MSVILFTLTSIHVNVQFVFLHTKMCLKNLILYIIILVCHRNFKQLCFSHFFLFSFRMNPIIRRHSFTFPFGFLGPNSYYLASRTHKLLTPCRNFFVFSFFRHSLRCCSQHASTIKSSPYSYFTTPQLYIYICAHFNHKQILFCFSTHFYL